MIELLNKIENSLAELLYKNVDKIKTMYIDYHKPYVSRIWFIDEENDCRVFLHKIEPCEESSEALYHPHKWDSAVRIVSGEYEMGVGHSETDEIPKTDCVLILGPGACYSMTEKNGWHYVSPRKGCVYTLMVIPNKLNGRKMPIEPEKKFRKLTSKEVEDMLYFFSEQYIGGDGFSVEFTGLIKDVQETTDSPIISEVEVAEVVAEVVEVKPEIVEVKPEIKPEVKPVEEIEVKPEEKIIGFGDNLLKVKSEEKVEVVEEKIIEVVEVKSEIKVEEFKRGDKVNFKGDGKYKPMKGTYVWVVSPHMMLMYYIEHPDGNITKQSIAHNGGLADGFETPHSKNFQEGLKYICVIPEQLEKANPETK